MRSWIVEVHNMVRADARVDGGGRPRRLEMQVDARDRHDAGELVRMRAVDLFGGTWHVESVEDAS
jgi:hypothetical protein